MILRDKRVRVGLRLPDFDDLLMTPSMRSPTEAEIVLRRGEKTVARYFVKYAVRGNVRYAISV